jgi:hypothetical protein
MCHTRSQFMCLVLGQGLICFKHGQKHRASECGFSGSCSQCGKSGHMRNVCNENQNSIIKWQLATPSSEGSKTCGSSHDANSGFVSSILMMEVPPHIPPLPTDFLAGNSTSNYICSASTTSSTTPPQQQLVGDSATSTSPGMHTMSLTSHGHNMGSQV